MYRKVNAQDRQDRQPVANPFQRLLDCNSSDEEFQDAIKAMQDDQDSHNHTDISTTRQIMFLDLKTKLDQFYDLYKELNRRGRYGARKPEPEDILDTKDVPALLHRLESFLSVRRQISTGTGGYGRPARGTIMQWTHTLLSLLKAHIVRDLDAATAVHEVRRVFRFNGDGTEGVYLGLLKHATFICASHDLPRSRDDLSWWSELDVRLIVDDILDSLERSTRPSHAEVALQTLALVQLVFCTGQRIGALTAKQHYSDHQRQLLFTHEDIVIRQTAPQQYSMTIKLRAIKGYTSHKTIEVENVISSFGRPENVVLNPIWTIVALLVRRRTLKPAGHQEAFKTVDEVLSSSFTHFVGVGQVPLFRKALYGQTGMSMDPQDQPGANSALLVHARNVGFTTAGFHKIRHDFAAQITTEVSAEVARLALSHQLHDDVLHRHYTGGASLFNLASVRVGEGGEGNNAAAGGPSRHGARVQESRALSIIANKERAKTTDRAKYSAAGIDVDADPAVAEAKEDVELKLKAAVAASGVALTSATKHRQKKLDEMTAKLRAEGKPVTVVEELRDAFASYSKTRASRRAHMNRSTRKDANKIAQSKSITIDEAAAARSEIARISQERSHKLLSATIRSFRLEFMREEAVKDLAVAPVSNTSVDSAGTNAFELKGAEVNQIDENDMVSPNAIAFTEKGTAHDSSTVEPQDAAVKLQAALMTQAFAKMAAASSIAQVVDAITALGVCFFCTPPAADAHTPDQARRGVLAGDTDVRAHLTTTHPSVVHALLAGHAVEPSWIVSPLVLPGAFTPPLWVQADPELAHAFYGMPAIGTDPELIAKYVGFSSLFDAAAGSSEYHQSLQQLHTTLLTTNTRDPKFVHDFRLSKNRPRRSAKTRALIDGIVKSDGSMVPAPLITDANGQKIKYDRKRIQTATMPPL
ncbi:hypothetical protein V8E36_005361 [Tilletia maclaganii]